MEKAATSATRAETRRELRWSLFAAAAACLACPAMAAQGTAKVPAEAVVVAQARPEPPLRLEVQTSTLPRFDRQDSGFQAPRVDFSLFPRAAAGLGAVFGMSGFTAPAPQALGLQPIRPSVDLGVRWTQRLQSQQIDITAWRRMNNEEDAYTLVQQRQPVYGARVEMNLGGRKSPFALERGFIGLQLEGGGRISVKRKNGGPMIYYRTTF